MLVCPNGKYLSSWTKHDAAFSNGTAWASLALSRELYMIYWKRHCRRVSVLHLNHNDMRVVGQYVDGFYMPMLELPPAVPPPDTAANLGCGIHKYADVVRGGWFQGLKTRLSPNLFYRERSQLCQMKCDVQQCTIVCRHSYTEYHTFAFK